MRALLVLTLLAPAALAADPTPVGYRLQLHVLHEGFDGKTSWFRPSAGVIPAAPGGQPTVVLTMQKWLVTASDVFLPVHSEYTTDLGKAWSPLVEHADTLGWRRQADGTDLGICDVTPKWHAASGKLIGTAHTVLYKDSRLVKVRPRQTVWSVYDPKAHTWSRWAAMKMPDEDRFSCAGAGGTQRVDLPDGDILLPIYFKTITGVAYGTTIVRCRYENGELRYVEHGSELSVNIDRGLYEPSLATFGGRFFLTMRNDRAAYISASDDGLHFTEPRKWTFNDGSDLGSYNTQAHWVTHADGLFLVYTRRGADNDNVARHRAPLFMAQVDPRKLVVIRATERELAPNKGAQLGNFAVVDVSDRETWVTTSEGMGPGDPRKFGANARVYAARILWDKPNTVWNQH